MYVVVGLFVCCSFTVWRLEREWKGLFGERVVMIDLIELN